MKTRDVMPYTLMYFPEDERIIVENAYNEAKIILSIDKEHLKVFFENCDAHDILLRLLFEINDHKQAITCLEQVINVQYKNKNGELPQYETN